MTRAQGAAAHDHQHCIDDALGRASTICAQSGGRLTPLPPPRPRAGLAQPRPRRRLRHPGCAAPRRTGGRTTHRLPRPRVPARARAHPPHRIAERLRRLRPARAPPSRPVPDLQQMLRRDRARRSPRLRRRRGERPRRRLLRRPRHHRAARHLPHLQGRVAPDAPRQPLLQCHPGESRGQ